MTLVTKVRNFSIPKDKLKTRGFYDNTIREYQVGSYLQKQNENKDHLSLHLDFVQTKGDFSLGAEGYELKENAGALKYGYLAFEVMNTKEIKPSGVMASQQFGIKNYIMYLPEKNWSHDRYKKFKHQLHIFEPKITMVFRQEYINAKKTIMHIAMLFATKCQSNILRKIPNFNHSSKRHI